MKKENITTNNNTGIYDNESYYSLVDSIKGLYEEGKL